MHFLLAISLTAALHAHQPLPETPATVHVIVPDITRLTLSAARDVLAASGLTLGHIVVDPSDASGFAVAGQSPMGGGTAARGSEVTVVVAALTTRHAEPTPEPGPAPAVPWPWVLGGLALVAAAGLPLRH